LLVQVEVDLERMNLAQEADEVLQRPSEPVDRPIKKRRCSPKI